MSYDIGRILQMWQSHDGDFAKTYLKDAASFHRMLLSNDELAALYMNTKITYDAGKSIPLLGGLSLMCSNAFRPKINSSTALLPFKVASANGAFIIYENNCCRGESSKKTEHFLKVALDNSDYMEIETVALRMIEQFVPRHLHKYFLTYRASTNMLVYKDPMTASIALDLGRYLNNTHHTNFFGEFTVNDPNTMIVPAIITRVVSSGISLGQIVSAWRYVTPTIDPSRINTLKDSMRIFHRSAVYDRAINNANLDERIILAARSKIISKLNEFIANVGIACAPLRFAHGDLHVGNIMYDMDTDNFVLIDYGRSTADLELKGISINFVMDEFSKIKSKSTQDVRPKLSKALDFYSVFDNVGMRKYFDPQSETTTYGILLDLASMTMHTITSLQGRLMIPDHPIISYSLYTNTFMISPLSDIYMYVSKAKDDPLSVTAVDLMQVYFAFILRAALASGLLDGKASIVGSSQERDNAFVVDMNDIFGYEKEGALFYLYGQPFPKVYGQYREALESLTSQCNFFSVFDEVAMKKRITAGLLDIDGNSIPIKKPKTSMDLKALTLENYIYNMQRNAEMTIATALPCHQIAPQNSNDELRRHQSFQPTFLIPGTPEANDDTLRQTYKRSKNTL